MRRPSADAGAASPPLTPRSDDAGSVEDVIAGLADLDAKGLRLQWRNHLGGTPPAHLPRWLLLRVLAYQFQLAALGGPDKATLRVIRQPKGRTLGSTESCLFQARIASTREGADLRAGALLVREWKGKPVVLEKGFAWNGKSYSSLSQIAKAMTGTAWNGHRFFGLRTATSARAAQARRGIVIEATARPDVASDGPIASEQVGHRCSLPSDAVASAAGSAALLDRGRRRNDAGAS
jgi:Protein of unknown function (DUF2924)